MTKLHVSPDLALPEDAVTRTFVVYGGKGKGKTNFGAVLTEELAKKHLRFCVTDPLDVWWGLQHGKTKDGQGIDVVILGGAHGDITIHPGAGELIADFVADETVSTVIVMRHADGKMWTAGERIRFMSAFVRRLFARQGEKRLPLMLVIDEAGRFVPQNPGKGDIAIAECIGAIEELVEWGRNVGIGCALITQRSARMNKSVSELAECMVAFQTAGPNSISAIVDWFGEHIDKARQRELVEALRKLPVGRALIVSPEWLGFEGEAQIRLRETFDSSATPKAGGALRAPGKARKPDLAKYEAKMAEVVERAKADDPTVLRRRIKELEADAAKAARSMPRNIPVEHPAKIETKTVTVYALREGQLARAERIVERGHELIDRFRATGAEAAKAIEAKTIEYVSDLGAMLGPLTAAIAVTKRPVPSAPPPVQQPSTGGGAVRAGSVAVPTRDAHPSRPDDSTSRSRAARESDGPARTTDLPAGSEKLARLAVSLEAIGIQPTGAALGAWAGLRPDTGYFAKLVRPLRDAGYLDGFNPTDRARGAFPPDLLDIEAVANGLKDRERRAFDAVRAAGATGITQAQLGEALGIRPDTGYFAKIVRMLRGRAIVEDGWPMRLASALERVA